MDGFHNWLCLFLQHELVYFQGGEFALLRGAFSEQISIIFAFGSIVPLTVAEIAVKVLFFRRDHQLSTTKDDIVVALID